MTRAANAVGVGAGRLVSAVLAHHSVKNGLTVGRAPLLSPPFLGHLGVMLAIEVPGSGTLNAGGNAQVEVGSVSCASAGNCAAGGFYTDGHSHQQAFVVSQA